MLITIVIVNSNLINYVRYNCVGSIEFCAKSLDYNEDYRGGKEDCEDSNAALMMKQPQLRCDLSRACCDCSTTLPPD